METSKILDSLNKNNIDYEVFNHVKNKEIDLNSFSILNNLDTGLKNQSSDFEVVFYDRDRSLSNILDCDHSNLLILINNTRKEISSRLNGKNRMVILINQEISIIKLFKILKKESNDILYNLINKDINTLYSFRKGSLGNISKLLFYYLGSSIGIIKNNKYIFKYGDYISNEENEILSLLYNYEKDKESIEENTFNHNFINYKNKVITFLELNLYNKKVGTLFIILDDEKNSRFSTLILNLISPYYILACIEEKNVDINFSPNKEKLMEDIIFRIIEDETTIIRNCGYLNIDYECRKFIWILEFIDKNENRLNNYKSIDRKHILKTIQKFFPNNIFIHNENEIISIQNKDNRADSEIKLIFENIIEKLELYFPNFNFQIGISKAYTNLKELREAYSDAVFSLQIGKEYLYGRNKIFYYDDIILYHLLINIVNNPILTRIYSNSILILLKYDEKNDTDLIKVVRHLVKNNYNIQKTSEELFLHRNTLYSRIGTIESLLEIDLDDVNAKILLYIAFKTYEVILVNEKGCLSTLLNKN